MSTETPGTAAKRILSSEGTETDPNPANLEQKQTQNLPQHASPSQSTAGETGTTTDEEETKPPASTGRATMYLDPSSSTTLTTKPSGDGSPTGSGEQTRQVIAVSASKSPAAFFNLARKFLVANEMCDLSALEGAIVSAVDAAHLLERSKLASIVGIHTSYVNVEPKRRKQAPQKGEQETTLMQPSHPETSKGDLAAVEAGGSAETSSAGTFSQAAQRSGASKPPESTVPSGDAFGSMTTTQGGRPGPRSSLGGRELRRARIVITVRRTESYKRWLEENPLQAIIASEENERAEEGEDLTAVQPAPSALSIS